MLNDYQIGQLVILIQNGDWNTVRRIASESGFEQPAEPIAAEGDAYLMTENQDDPHRCVACHEDPKIHKDKFGLNCARCHSSVAWTPALLTKHVFALDHGGQGDVDCTVCHAENYYSHDCYACHDHTIDQMEEVHLAEKIVTYDQCITCHPTGAPDEARRMMNDGLLQGITDASGLSDAIHIPELPVASVK